MTPPRVSVILCGYNQRAYVLDSVESVLRQTYPHVELVLIDNGSTDGSRDLLAPYVSRPNVRLMLYDTNAPITKRMNEGIAAATGDFLSILYGDDEYLPEKTELQLARFAQLGPDYGVVHSPGFRLDVATGERWVERGLTASGDVARELVTRYHEVTVNPVSPLVRRECFERYPFDESVFTEGEDRYLFIALRYRFAYLDEPLVVMREHADNLGKAYLRNYECALHVLAALERTPELPAALRPEIARARRLLRRRVGWELVRVAPDASAARGILAAALAEGLDAKTMLGYALALLPARLRVAANAVVNAVRRPRRGLQYRSEWR